MNSTGFRFIPVAIAAVLILGADDASAQAPRRRLGPPSMRRSQKSAISPYINLSAGDGDTDIEGSAYFQITRPQVNAQRNARFQEDQIRNLNLDVEEQRRMLQQSATSGLSSTGHKTQFMNYGSYFSSSSGGAPASQLGRAAAPEMSALRQNVMPRQPGMNGPR